MLYKIGHEITKDIKKNFCVLSDFVAKQKLNWLDFHKLKNIFIRRKINGLGFSGSVGLVDYSWFPYNKNFIKSTTNFKAKTQSKS